MRRLVATALTALALMASPAAAQQLIGSFYTLLTQRDFYNSSGTRLGSIGQILQQDRANYHRFGNRDDLDDWDPYFADRNLRSQIERLYLNGPRNLELERWVMSGNTLYVYVEVYGQGARPTAIVLHQGAG